MQYDDGDWKELRGRIDSLSNAVFLIAGGALTLSISVLLRIKETGVDMSSYAEPAASAWHMLLVSIISFVTLKTVLIGQSFARGLMKPETYNPTIKYTNTLGWLVGLGGLTFFIWGMYRLVRVAILVLCSS